MTHAPVVSSRCTYISTCDQKCAVLKALAAERWYVVSFVGSEVQKH